MQSASAKLAESIDVNGSEYETAVRQGLHQLAHNEMLRAVQTAESMAAMQQWNDLGQELPSLISVQDQIIDRLRQLLAATRRAMSESLTEMKERAGGDLPNDIQDKLRELGVIQ